ncbi:MAG: hypothetical protein K2K10_08600, partial [Acetatifactor sp.]|nr:hypothetical protein [Acetatifactor sp.]
EYHRELVKQYNIFAIDASYGPGTCCKENTESHLKAYLERNLSVEDIFLSQFLYRDFFGLELKKAELSKVLILTDGKGAVFREKAVEALGDDIGLGLLKDIQEWMRVIEVNGLDNGGTEEEKHNLDAEVESYNGIYIEEQKDVWVPFNVDNPTSALEEKRGLGILKLVTEDEAQLSQRVLGLDKVIMNRMQQGTVNQGNVKLLGHSRLESVADRFLFQEYLLKYMGRFGCEQEEDVLKYQVEYLVSGKDSDVENLRSVAGRLCAVREAANALYLLSNSEKRAEAQLIAEFASVLLWVPELAPILEAAILLGWAFAESVYDVRSLLNGGRVPLLKNDESWHYSLSSALWGDLQDETREGSGMSYADYLRLFMMFTDLETLTGRAMNIVEADIRSTPGNAAFRLDGCLVRVEADIQIDSTFGYRYTITRQAGYD